MGRGSSCKIIVRINEFLVGYIEGAQAVNPDIKVATSYVGSFTDTAKGKENALLLYNSGLSVIFAAAGQSGLGVIDAAVASLLSELTLTRQKP